MNSSAHAKQTDVIVIGGGIIGCSIAFHLQQAGKRCIVFEQGQIGNQASKAGAGMLGAQVEMANPGPIYDLGIQSRGMFPELSGILYEISGVDIEYQKQGILRLATSEDEVKTLQNRKQWQEASGQTAEWLTPAELQAMTSGAVFSAYGALYLPNDHQVRNPPLVRAFASSAKKLGASFYEHTEVTGFLYEQDRIIGVATQDQTWYAEYIVIAGGAFSSVLGRKLELDIPVFPVKGQAILANGTMPVPYTVFTHGCYLVPKLTDQVYIGATEQPNQKDLTPSLGSIAKLSNRAAELVPVAESFSYGKSIIGLRPGSVDSLPILGEATQYKGLFLATGHFRNGVLLSPITGKIITDLITKGISDVDITPFLLERFQEKAVIS
ncbi:glycine oxidase ThiO [Fodinisporobacter ferrooxydans]|uniref:glycine oxidase n=1 Tax=Fodinisporobacter ferrooxydans TaxID=2901836 RepID=A0ABY4CIU2_9BACL|nr:glycine oxidase ThiO [Alicyclobacillaceae bacterium MYW30-H2]